MPVNKIRATDANGLVPAGQYFKLLSEALSKANARDQRAKAFMSAGDARADRAFEPMQ